MKYFTRTRKRRRGGRQEWIARLVYKDDATGVNPLDGASHYFPNRKSCLHDCSVTTSRE